MKRLPLRSRSTPAVPADDLGDQVTRRAGDVEQRRVELNELEVADARASAEGEAHAIARRDHGVGGLAVDLPPAAGREEDLGTLEQHQVSASGAAQDADRSTVVIGQEIDAEGVREEGDVGSVGERLRERSLHLLPRRISVSVHDARVRVTAFARELQLAVGRPVELGAELNESLDGARASAHDGFDHLAIGESAADSQRVIDVGLERILLRDDRGHPALGIARVALREVGLRHHGDGRAVARRGERCRGSADSTAENDQVEAVDRDVAGIEGKQITLQTESSSEVQRRLGAWAPLGVGDEF